jgi:mannose-6-phosphate isomerase-like protein (cupin superfamily)
MEAGQMIRVGVHKDAGFKVMIESGEWKVGMLHYNERFSRLGEMERHLLTDEVFVLVSGKATLYTESEAVEMEQGPVYTVPVGVWHHIVVSEDANVIVVENRNTSIENTEKRYFEQEKR